MLLKGLTAIYDLRHRLYVTSHRDLETDGVSMVRLPSRWRGFHVHFFRALGSHTDVVLPIFDEKA